MLKGRAVDLRDTRWSFLLRVLALPLQLSVHAPVGKNCIRHLAQRQSAPVVEVQLDNHVVDEPLNQFWSVGHLVDTLSRVRGEDERPAEASKNYQFCIGVVLCFVEKNRLTVVPGDVARLN